MQLVALSFIAEYEYCPRSSYWKFVGEAPRGDEFSLIADGNAAHQSVDSGYTYSKSAKKVKSSVRVFSERYGISGRVDILEFYQNNEIIPIELKRGSNRVNSMHQLQLALTALCIQEMYPHHLVRRAAIFFTEDRHKEFIDLSPELLKKAQDTATLVHKKIENGLNPKDFPMQKDERCKGCCFYDLCYI